MLSSFLHGAPGAGRTGCDITSGGASSSPSSAGRSDVALRRARAAAGDAGARSVAALDGMMFDALARWIPGLDPATGILAVPPWAAAIGAALLALLCLFVLIRCLIGLA